MSLQSVQIKRLEEQWISLPCAFESFVPADELLLNFQVAAFNLSNKKHRRKGNAKYGPANENVQKSGMFVYKKKFSFTLKL